MYIKEVKQTKAFLTKIYRSMDSINRKFYEFATDYYITR